MALIRVKERYQVTIPGELRRKAGVSVGDCLKAEVSSRGVITLAPQDSVARRIAEGLADIRAGRVYGPYDTVEKAMAAMNEQIKKPHARNRKTRRSR